MRILFLSSYVDPGSGASILCRLTQNLQNRGHEVKILTTQPGFDSDVVESILMPRSIQLLNRSIHRITPNYFSLNYSRLLHKIRLYNPDIVNIHWTHGYTIPIRIIPELHKSFPIFWSIHDLWPITANSFFVYTGGGSLSTVKTASFRDAIKRIRISPEILLEYKTHLLGKVAMHTISPSKWLQQMVNSSRVFRSSFNHHIPNGVDTDIFRCLDRDRIRDKYDVPRHHSVILFLAANLADERKGFYYFVKAIEQLRTVNPELSDRITVVLVGENGQHIEAFFKTNVKCLGSTRNTSQLVEYFNLADVFVSTSLADNFPSTSLESSACGTPIVAFDVGGVSEIVINNKTGLLAPSKNVIKLADNISQMLSDRRLLGEMKINCRNYVADSFGMTGFVDKYVKLFQSELERRRDA